MDLIEVIARVILGLLFFVFGLNGFIKKIPIPPPSAQMGALLDAMDKSKYLMPTIKIIEILAGAMLLVGFGRAVAVILLAPLIYNIVFMQVYLNRFRDPVIVALVAIPYAVLCILYWPIFHTLLSF